MLRGGVALRRRRLPVDRLEYSHADVPVAQGIGLSDKYTFKLSPIATSCLDLGGEIHFVNISYLRSSSQALHPYQLEIFY